MHHIQFPIFEEKFRIHCERCSTSILSSFVDGALSSRSNEDTACVGEGRASTMKFYVNLNFSCSHSDSEREPLEHSKFMLIKCHLIDLSGIAHHHSIYSILLNSCQWLFALHSYVVMFSILRFGNLIRLTFSTYTNNVEMLVFDQHCI